LLKAWQIKAERRGQYWCAVKEIGKNELEQNSAPVAAGPEAYALQEDCEGQLTTAVGSLSAAAGSTFATTHWSLVRKAGQTNPNVSAAALEALCRTYWRPIYAFIRRYRNSTPEDAEDLTQAFFEHLFENATLKKATESKGKFRSFLLGALEKFMANEADRKRAWKRGGRHKFVSLDETREGLNVFEPADSVTPEMLFTRNWAAALLNRVLLRLEKEYTEKGQYELFKRLEPALAQVDEEGFYQRCARELGKSEAALKVAMHRLRQRYREMLLGEIAQTVSCPGEVEEELRFLVSALGNHN
jgi:RNA polymerase sigma factor (sigma-70 family)